MKKPKPFVHKYQLCIACGKRLKFEVIKSETLPDKFDHWGIIYDGVICRTRGNYGSTIYDPMDSDEYLQFYLCDHCVETKANRIERNIVGKRKEPLPEYFRRLNENKKIWEAYSKFKKEVAGDKQLSIWETRVLWLLQGLKKGLVVNYGGILSGTDAFNFKHGEHGLTSLDPEVFNFVIQKIKVAIMVGGKTCDFLNKNKDKDKDDFEETEKLRTKYEAIGWKVLIVRPSDSALLNKGLGKCFTFLEEPLRNRIIDLVGRSNYSKLPEREPSEDD